MNYRDIEVLAPKDLGASGTEIIDLNLLDPISAIEFFWQTTVATVSDMTAPHLRCLSKIELVDGSDVIFSLSGEELQALNWFLDPVMPAEELSVVIGDYCRSVARYNFGRKLYDPELALNPSKFRNLQLKITYDEDAAGAAVVANALTVRATVFDEKQIAPKGFLMTKEIKSFTPVVSAYEYTDLPTDYPYRLLMLRNYSTDKNPFEVLNQFKLSEDMDKRIPYDLTGSEIFRKFALNKNPIFLKVRLNETAADAMALYLPMTYDQVGAVNYDADVIAANDDFTQISFAGCICTVAATVSYVPYTLAVKGMAPHFCMAIPFGDLNDLGDMYDVIRLKQLRLTTQGAAAVGTSPSSQIVGQQVRSY